MVEGEEITGSQTPGKLGSRNSAWADLDFSESTKLFKFPGSSSKPNRKKGFASSTPQKPTFRLHGPSSMNLNVDKCDSESESDKIQFSSAPDSARTQGSVPLEAQSQVPSAGTVVLSPSSPSTSVAAASPLPEVPPALTPCLFNFTSSYSSSQPMEPAEMEGEGLGLGLGSSPSPSLPLRPSLGRADCGSSLGPAASPSPSLPSQSRSEGRRKPSWGPTTEASPREEADDHHRTSPRLEMRRSPRLSPRSGSSRSSAVAAAAAAAEETREPAVSSTKPAESDTAFRDLNRARRSRGGAPPPPPPRLVPPPHHTACTSVAASARAARTRGGGVAPPPAQGVLGQGPGPPNGGGESYAAAAWGEGVVEEGGGEGAELAQGSIVEAAAC